MRTLLALVTCLTSGCLISYREGPRFVPVVSQPDGYGLVYTYRPQKTPGAVYAFDVAWKTRTVSLASGSYAVWLLPEGTQQLCARSFPQHMQQFGVIKIPREMLTGCHLPIPVTVKKGVPQYVRLEFQNIEEPVGFGVATTSDERLADCFLAPGGRARTPVADGPQSPAREPKVMGRNASGTVFREFEK